MFALTVPIATVDIPETEIAENEVVTNGALAIAVIDDERDALDAISLLLKTLGHRVYAGRSATEACRAHAEASLGEALPIDIVITDYRLEAGANGLEAIDQMRRYADRCLPAIILTGDTSPARLKQVSESGHSLLHKPVDAEQVQKAIFELLAVQSRDGPSNCK
ncbi:response regulator [Rhizobium sp. YK2]|uniref:response regulator n=2 Tax=Rhizobium TaxID=379 RepID=UPI00084C5776|nr:response regulator [Rhizobium sp. YK2]OEC94694.1 hypothetical protein A9Z06_06490 [Rhizobium sp. YK2]